MRDPAVRVKPHPDASATAPDAADIDKLCEDPRWALWVWNPNLDNILPTYTVAPEQWVAMCLTPLHAPCARAVKALGTPMMQRIMHGEVAPSHRRRYVSHRTHHPRS